MTISIRELHTMSEFQSCVPLQLEVWGMEPGLNTSSYMMNAVVHNGGAVHGAYDGDRLVGFTFGFAARRHDDWLLWSHMAGVLPAYQGRGVGRKLKLAQREWATQAGYPAIGWTFDPMQAGNARFNLRHLDAIAFHFHPNHYGTMTDALNRGLASDRLEATWYTSAVSPLEPGFEPEDAVELVADDGALALPDAWDAAAYSVHIPANINDLKQNALETAARWQTAVREALVTAFAQGYAAADFVTQGDGCYYVLRKRAL